LTWSLAGGAFHTGLALADDGTVTGKPSGAGSFGHHPPWIIEVPA
jgi:hypothetical protein